MVKGDGGPAGAVAEMGVKREGDKEGELAG